MAGPTDQEQLLLEYTNEARLDPIADAARYIASYSPLVSNDPQIQASLQYFGVVGTTLQSAFAALTPVQPLAWNESLSSSSHAHDQLMLAGNTQSHQLAGEAALGARITAAGYGNWSMVGENIYSYAQSPLYAQAGFMVDWGPGTDGMQVPAGHRENIMNASLNEVGIAILYDYNPATAVGPLLVTEDFGVRFGGGSFVVGVAYTDRNHDDFYSVGEGRGDLVVGDASGSVTSWASGGFSLAKTSAAQAVTLSGGGLAGVVTVGIPAVGTNAKLDVVNGTELKVTGAVTVAGPVATIEGVGFNVGITVTDTAGHLLLGTAHDDVLTAGAGASVIQGGAGNDTITGGAGNDHLYGQSPSGGPDGADLISGGDGNDYIQGNAGNDTIHGGNGDDRINGGADDDRLYGDAGNDSINGNAGNDWIDGGAGNDYLRGGQGDDTINGGDGNDVLMGDLGNDRLIGGAGIDILTGGAGADTFVFSGSDAAFATSGPLAGFTDLITDFVPGTDHIALGFATAAVLHAGAADFTAAVVQAQTLLAGTANDVAAVQVGSDTYLFYGSSGGAAVDSAIKLAGVATATIATSDFV